MNFFKNKITNKRMDKQNQPLHIKMLQAKNDVLRDNIDKLKTDNKEMKDFIKRQADLITKLRQRVIEADEKVTKIINIVS